LRRLRTGAAHPIRGRSALLQPNRGVCVRSAVALRRLLRGGCSSVRIGVAWHGDCSLVLARGAERPRPSRTTPSMDYGCRRSIVRQVARERPREPSPARRHSTRFRSTTQPKSIPQAASNCVQRPSPSATHPHNSDDGGGSFPYSVVRRRRRLLTRLLTRGARRSISERVSLNRGSSPRWTTPVASSSNSSSSSSNA